MNRVFSVSGWSVSSAVFLAFASLNASAQFTHMDGALPDDLIGEAAFGDAGNDGDLDVLTGGGNFFTDLVVSTNETGSFTPVPVGFPPTFGAVRWGDYDSDGDLDVLISGFFNTGGRFTDVYENDGGVFTALDVDFPSVFFDNVWWVDFDGDGDLDILFTGQNFSGNVVADVYLNDLGVFTPMAAGISGVRFANAAWGDYDNDGDLDVVVTGEDRFGTGVTHVYRNDAGSLTAIDTGLPGVRVGVPAWADCDGDNDLDLLLVGRNGFGPLFAEVYENDGGVFTAMGAGLRGLGSGDAAWGDYDGDGDPDLLVSGETASGTAYTDLYNNEDGTLSIVPAGLPGLADGTVAWGDYDGDGDLDILLSGEFNDPDHGPVWVTQLWRNDFEPVAANGLPMADAGGPYMVECRDAADGSTTVVLDGSASSDPDGDPLNYAWVASMGSLDDATLTQPTLDVTGLAPGTVIDVMLTVDDGTDSDVAVTTVEVQDTWAPEIVCPADMVVAPTSLAGAVVNYSPTATDACDASPEVVSDPPSGSVFPMGSSTLVTVTATDDAGNTAMCSFMVTVMTVEEVLEDMATNVEDLGLNHGYTTQLLVDLENIQKWFEKGKTNQACKKLDQFVRDVQRSIDQGKTDPATGQALIETAYDLRETFGC